MLRVRESFDHALEISDAAAVFALGERAQRPQLPALRSTKNKAQFHGG